MTSSQAAVLAAWLVGSVAFWATVIFGMQRLLRQDWATLGEFVFLLLPLVTFATGAARLFTAWSWPACIAAGVMGGPLAWAALGSVLVAVGSAGAWLLDLWRGWR